MGRHQKVSAFEVLEALEEMGQVKIAALAKMYNVNPATIKSRLKQLRKDHVPLVHGQNGTLILDRPKVENNDEGTADIFYDFMVQQVGLLKHVAIAAECTKPYYPALKRAMKGVLTVEQKRQLSQRIVRLGTLMAYSAEEDEEAGIT